MNDDLLHQLRTALGNPRAEFHQDQKEAIEAVLRSPYRALVVEATGWGKSMVYFIATKLLRQLGKGPTLVVSPLLSLMRNQVSAASNLGLVADHYTSANTDSWEAIQQRLLYDQIDLLLISPERLASPDFQAFVASSSLSEVGLLVIDEAHCISDWGHDFRPDYQRLGQLIRRLPPTTSVLATTATANDRVVEDVLAQIGGGPTLIRGSLARDSLHLQVIRGLRASERLAWLDTHLNDLPGSGIIYTLTTRDADRVAEFLSDRGHSVEAYHSKLSSNLSDQTQIRVGLEQRLQANVVKALAATVALGMGFDKPDLGFVVHYQSPGNLVAYYQQIGRAGRAIPEAVAILFLGEEDDDIHDFFIQGARPSAAEIDDVLGALDAAEDGLSIPKLMEVMDRRSGEIEKVIKLLAVLDPSPISKVGSKWRRTPAPYFHDHERDAALELRKRAERERFLKFAASGACLMLQVRQELNDARAEECGRCANCLGESILPTTYAPESLHEALQFLNRSEFLIEPRKQWPRTAFGEYGFHGRITLDRQCSPGLCLSHYGDPGVAAWVKEDKRGTGLFRDDLVDAAMTAISRSLPDSRVDWVTSVPSLRSPLLVPNFAQRLASRLGKPYVEAVVKARETAPQKQQRNGYHQAKNLDGAFGVQNVAGGSVLLVDDMVDSRWTFTVIGALLRRAGAAEVIPLALSSSAPREDDE